MADRPAVRTITGKRKRNDAASTATARSTLHITVGSYERVLHGFTASIDTTLRDAEHLEDVKNPVEFRDSFLLNAHTSAIRCLALSPPTSHRRTLATGGTDERINLFQISTVAPPVSVLASMPSKRSKQKPLLPTPATTPTFPAPISTPSANRTLGTLANHNSTITKVHFPTSTKLLTASLDNTIAILRSRDWTPLTTLRAPIPTPHGRPSGDTVGPGEVPAGVTDVAVHPSLKLAISVGVGERCMRLWNLVTGKKSGVLMFEKPWLAAAGEGSSVSGSRIGLRGGEAKSILWREDGEQFVVGFERGALIFGLDCQVRGALRVGARDKIARLRYLPRSQSPNSEPSARGQDADDTPASNGHTANPDSVLAVSTESGDLLFYDIPNTPRSSEAPSNASVPKTVQAPDRTYTVLAKLTSRLSTESSSSRSRIKDFMILPAPITEQSLPSSHESETKASHYIVTATSLGSVRIYNLDAASLRSSTKPAFGTETGVNATGNAADTEATHEAALSTTTNENDEREATREVGRHIASFETGKRITCLAAFVMDPAATNTPLSTFPGDRMSSGDQVSHDQRLSDETGEGEEDSSGESVESDSDDDDVDGKVLPYAAGISEEDEEDREGEGADDFGGFDD